MASKATSKRDGGVNRSTAAKRATTKANRSTAAKASTAKANRSAAAKRSPKAPAAKRKRGTTAVAGTAAGDTRTVKVSVALPRRLWEEARAAVGDGSLSALVTSAVRRELAGRRTDSMLAELDDVYGPVPADVQAEIDAEWRKL